MPSGVYQRTDKHKAQIAAALKRRWEVGARTWTLSPEDRAKRKGVQTNTGRTHFKPGYIPFNKGKRHSDETRQKISNSLQGRTAWNKGMYGWRSGENNPNWKGGVHTENNALRRTKRYKAWRTAVFVRDDFTCQMCQARGVALNADHIKPFAFFPELRFEISNGRTLCVPCHENTPTYKNPKKIKDIQ